MLYHYLASDKEGKISESDYDAQSLGDVLQYLAGKELRPISVKPLKEKSTIRGLFGGIKIDDKVFLTKYLSLMLKVGTDLLSAINILIADFDNPAMKNLLLEVRDNLSRGQPFYETFTRYPKIFSSVFTNLIKAAEASGNLQQTFDDLSVSMQREAELRSRIRAALIYPVILLVSSLAVFVFLVTFALPKISKVFTESGINPPFFSRIVFGVGLFVNDNLLMLSILFVLITVPSVLFFFKHPVGKRILDRVMSNAPFVKRIYNELALQRFASTYSALMKAGLPIIQTTKITAEVVGSESFRLSLIRIADEGLAKGLTIGDAFRREIIFPRVVTNLVAISEKAGHLEEVLGTLSEFYAANVDSNVRALTSVIEPILLIVMGGLVGLIALSIIVPIYQLTTQF